MRASRWLRDNAQHYLLVAAQDRVAREYDARPPLAPHGASEIFWRLNSYSKQHAFTER